MTRSTLTPLFADHPERISVYGSSVYMDERWVSGTYVVAGLFFKSLRQLESSLIEAEASSHFQVLRERKKRRWPRGICGYYAIPVYVCEIESPEVVRWVQNRPKYRYAMWHEPVVYFPESNEVAMSANWGVYGLFFRHYLAEIIFSGLCRVTEEAGHSDFPTVNGQVVGFTIRPAA